MITLAKSTDLTTPCLTPEQVSKLESDFKEFAVFHQTGQDIIRVRVYFKTAKIINQDYCYLDINNTIQLPILTALNCLSRFNNNFVTKLYV